MSAAASWTPSGSYNGAGFSSYANDLGHTEAYYDRSGYSIEVDRLIQADDRSIGVTTILSDSQTSSYVLASYDWSEETYMWGFCKVVDHSNGADSGYARVDSSM